MQFSLDLFFRSRATLSRPPIIITAFVRASSALDVCGAYQAASLSHHPLPVGMRSGSAGPNRLSRAAAAAATSFLAPSPHGFS